MNILNSMTDDAVLAEIGKRIARHRLNHQATQADLAEQAGVSKRTLERIEAGESAQMSSIIRVLRVLDLLPGLDHLIPVPAPRPMDLLQRKGKIRKRASSRKSKDPIPPKWSWGDES